MSGVNEGRALSPWNILMVWWTAQRAGRRIGGGDWWRSPLNWAGNDFSRDDPLRFLLALFGRMDASASAFIFLGLVGDLEVETGEKQCPPGLTRIEPFSITEVLQVFVVGENEERLCSSLQPVPPFFEGQLDCKKFSIADVVILLRRAEFPGEEGTWMESGRRPLLLREHRSYPGGRGVDFYDEEQFGIRMDKEWCTGENLLEGVKCFSGNWIPGQGLGLAFEQGQ